MFLWVVQTVPSIPDDSSATYKYNVTPLFRFARNGFYKSTRFRGGSLDDDDDDLMSYEKYQDYGSGPELGNIPEKYFVTVSGFEEPARATPHVIQKQRNVTEV